MSLKKYSILFFICLSGWFVTPALAQQPVTLSESIEAALKKNFYLNIARNEVLISENNNNLGNAGFLPTVDVTGSFTTSQNNLKQEYSNGNVVNQDKAGTDNLNGAVELNWVLFDGMRMFATKRILATTAESEQLRLKTEIENVVSAVMGAYYNVVRLQQAIAVTEANIKLYEERLKIADTRYTIGSASKLELLQATVDRNEQKSILLNQRSELDNAILILNRLTGASEFNMIVATDSITNDYTPDLNQLQKSVLTNNVSLQQSMKYLDLASGTINEFRASRYPWFSANAGYRYNKTQNDAGFSLLNQNHGPFVGLSLSWNLFNGMKTNSDVQNAKIQLRSSQLNVEDIRSKIMLELSLAYRSYVANLEILKLEEASVNFAEENVTVALEAYKLGSISMIEMREAQHSYESAYSRLIEIQYRTKLSEITLMKLNGDLVK